MTMLSRSRLARRADEGARLALCRWLEECGGTPKWTYAITLGEGWIIAHEFARDDTGQTVLTPDGNDVERVQRRYPCTTLPPVWKPIDPEHAEIRQIGDEEK